jgi:hypothetical protein
MNTDPRNAFADHESYSSAFELRISAQKTKSCLAWIRTWHPSGSTIFASVMHQQIFDRQTPCSSDFLRPTLNSHTAYVNTTLELDRATVFIAIVPRSIRLPLLRELFRRCLKSYS